MITLDSIIDNLDGTVTVIGHDDGGVNYTSIIGLISAPNPGNSADPKNITYYQSYIESTVPPQPKDILGN